MQEVLPSPGLEPGGGGGASGRRGPRLPRLAPGAAGRRAHPPGPRPAPRAACVAARTPSRRVRSRCCGPEALVLDGQLPGLRLRETRRSELPIGANQGFILPETRLIFSPSAVRAHVQLRRDRLRARPGRHRQRPALAAAALERGVRRHPRISSSAHRGSAPCARWRGSMEDAPGGSSRGGGAHLAPGRHRRLRRGGAPVRAPTLPQEGQRSAGTRVSRRKLLQEHAALLSPTDARVAALLPDGGGPASTALLHELVDHPHVHLEGAPDAPRAVWSAPRWDWSPRIAGARWWSAPGSTEPRCPATAARAPPPRAARGGAVPLGGGQPPAHRARRLARGARAARRAPAARERLSAREPRRPARAASPRWPPRVPVAMPRSVMGEALAAAGAARWCGSRPSPEGTCGSSCGCGRCRTRPPCIPGEGPRDVHVRRGTRSVHTVRDPARERAAALELQVRLPLAGRRAQDDAPFSFLVSERPGRARAALRGGRAASRSRSWSGWATELKLAGRARPRRAQGRAGAQARLVRRARRALGGGRAGRAGPAARRGAPQGALRPGRHARPTWSSRGRSASTSSGSRITRHRSRHGLELGPSAAEALSALEHAGAAGGLGRRAGRTLVERIFAAKELNPRMPARAEDRAARLPARGLPLAHPPRLLGRGRRARRRHGPGQDGAGAGGAARAARSSARAGARAHLGRLQLDRRGAALRALAAAARCTPTSEDRGGTLEQLGPRDVLVLSYGLLTRDVERLAAVRFATVVFDEAQSAEERADPALPGGARAAGRLPLRPLRHAAREPPRRAVEPLRHRLPRPARELGVLPRALRRAHREAGRSHRRAGAGAGARSPSCCAGPRPRSRPSSRRAPTSRVPVVLSPRGVDALRGRPARGALGSGDAEVRSCGSRSGASRSSPRSPACGCSPRTRGCTTRTRSVESSKLERFLELVEELRAEGHRALVFSQFTSHLALVREVLDAQGIAYEYLDGQTPQGARGERVRAFQEGDAPLFLISLKAGGFGLNLTAATQRHPPRSLVEPGRRGPGLRPRAPHRPGQRPVTVYRLVARGTIEEQMLALHEHKRALVAGRARGQGRRRQAHLAGSCSICSPSASRIFRGRSPRRRGTDPGSRDAGLSRGAGHPRPSSTPSSPMAFGSPSAKACASPPPPATLHRTHCVITFGQTKPRIELRITTSEYEGTVH